MTDKQDDELLKKVAELFGLEQNLHGQWVDKEYGVGDWTFHLEEVVKLIRSREWAAAKALVEKITSSGEYRHSSDGYLVGKIHDISVELRKGEV